MQIIDGMQEWSVASNYAKRISSLVSSFESALDAITRDPNLAWTDVVFQYSPFAGDVSNQKITCDAALGTPN